VHAGPVLTLEEYKSEKKNLLDTLDTYPASSSARNIAVRSNYMILDRLATAESSDTNAVRSTNYSASVSRVERVVQQMESAGEARWTGGALTLTEGSGLDLEERS
jgi:hypothetical protein